MELGKSIQIFVQLNQLKLIINKLAQSDFQFLILAKVKTIKTRLSQGIRKSDFAADCRRLQMCDVTR